MLIYLEPRDEKDVATIRELIGHAKKFGLYSKELVGHVKKYGLFLPYEANEEGF